MEACIFHNFLGDFPHAVSCRVHPCGALFLATRGGLLCSALLGHLVGRGILIQACSVQYLVFGRCVIVGKTRIPICHSFFGNDVSNRFLIGLLCRWCQAPFGSMYLVHTNRL